MRPTIFGEYPISFATGQMEHLTEKHLSGKRVNQELDTWGPTFG